MQPTPESPADSAGELYVKTPVTPEEVFQAIGRLRKEARDEIDRLIRFLDKTDDYVSRELEEAADDVPCDTDELEVGEGDDEPSLGSHVTPSGATSYSMPISLNGDYDCEGDEHDGREPGEDDEPSLCGINADCRYADDKDREQDLGSFDRMMDQTNSTAVRSNWTSVEGGEIDATL